MPKYVIERDVPGIGKSSGADLRALAHKSCNVLRELGPNVVWQHSYITGDKIYCLYVAPNKDLVLEHAKRGGFPANHINEVKAVIDPATEEG